MICCRFPNAKGVICIYHYNRQMENTIILILQVTKWNKEVRKLAKGHKARSDLTQSALRIQSFNFHVLPPPIRNITEVMKTKV